MKIMGNYLKMSHGSRSIRRTLCFVLAAFLFFGGIITGVFAASKGSYVTAERTTEEDEEISVDPTSKGEGYSAVLYNNMNGLPTSEANAIAETDEGFIWIGTNDNGVAVMEKGEYKHYSDVEGLKSSSIRSIAEDPEGNIFIATTHGLGMVDADLVLHPLDEPQINEEYICELRRGVDGVIYGETMDGDIFTIENQRLTGFYDSERLGIYGVYTVLPDEDNPGYVYIGTNDSKVYYGKLNGGIDQMNMYQVSPLTVIKSMEKIGGQVWICSDNGIGILENGNLKIVEKVPMDNSIDHMMVDYEGNLWFTSSRQGVMKIVPNQFTDIFEWYELDARVVNATCVANGMLFIGSDNGLVVLGNKDVIESLPITKVYSKRDTLKNTNDLIAFLNGVRIRSVIKRTAR